MLTFPTKLLALICAGFAGQTSLAAERVEFTRDFAPSEGWVKPPEQPWRQELCLNGRWQFQPMSLPRDWKRDTGVPPELPPPVADQWDPTPIKIPSFWNVNTWGAARNAGEGTPHPYWPSAVYYPSFPARWDAVEMGWLKRPFRVPETWGNRRLVLHFEAVGGDAQVFINGKMAGSYCDRFLPWELDITDLVQRGGENELLVGVRSLRLFDQRSTKYKHMRTPYPPGSNTDNLAGLWQDVFLLGLPPVRVADVFVKPFVDRDLLEAEVTVRNDSTHEQSLEVGGSVQPWINLTGTNLLDAPEPKWRLAAPGLSLPAQRVTLPPGKTKTLTLREAVKGRLKLWSPETPNLNGLVLTVRAGGETLDRSYTRFGWRQCQINGRDLLLNGQKVQLFGDLLHPFGTFVNSRRYVWAWYQMIKDLHGNAVRPHAQPHPRHYLDLADEMGLLVLDETALFGSSLQLNFEAPAAWNRYAEHYDNLIRRDRNHPSVFGWSWGNELFASFIYEDAITQEQKDKWYAQLADLGARGRPLDDTRNWFSCDGDEDVRGTMPVWNKHFGLGRPHPDWLPKEPTKPLMIGESGGSYYARPEQLAVFNGERAYESYLGRNEALAMDVYDNIVHLAQPRLAFFSPAETAWFGLEPLNLGYHDFSRLPNTNDGIWLKPFEEGKPGVQPERLPPYVCTFNPGWDPALPLYRPLPMFEAQRAALAPGGPQPCAWEHQAAVSKPAVPEVPATIDRVAFAGAREGELFARLTALGVPFGDASSQPAKLLLVDAATLTDARLPQAKQAAAATLAEHGTVWVMFRQGGEGSAAVNQLLPVPVSLTPRHATSLVPGTPHAWPARLSLTNLYFAEDATDKQILKCGLAGPFVQRGTILLQAANTDWSLFNNAPENAKCAAVVLSEHLNKPSGAALVAQPQAGGQVLVSSLDCIPTSPVHARFWHALFANLGVRLDTAATGQATGEDKPKAHDLLLNGPPTQKP